MLNVIYEFLRDIFQQFLSFLIEFLAWIKFYILKSRNKVQKLTSSCVFDLYYVPYARQYNPLLNTNHT